MGSYAQCWLDTFFVGSTKNDLDPALISLFRASDKVVLAPMSPELPSSLHHYREALEDGDDLRVIYYQAPVDQVRDRLDVMGYNLETAAQAFREWILGELNQVIASRERLDIADDKTRYIMQENYQSEIRALSSLTPDLWIENMKLIKALGLQRNYGNRQEGPHENEALDYMLSHEWYGFPGYDLYIPIRLAIEACSTSEKLIYDLTDLSWSEEFDYEEDFVAEYSSIETIVLTEGKTDAWILEQALRVLYPHLQDYYSFLDFEVCGIGGGVGNLANMVKAFAGAGIVNDVLAIFDNDTAAAAACKSLATIVLPANIATRRLPEQDLLRNYPTVGPSGEVNLDVNGIAASIELYLGEDVLIDDAGRFTPVQWTGYDRGMKQYQGEVLDKSELHRRFQRKVESWNGSSGEEWDGLRSIWSIIFRAFDEEKRNLICRQPTDYYSR